METVDRQDVPSGQPISIDAEELISALEGSDGDIRWFLDRQTGDVLPLFPEGFADNADDTAERIDEDPDRFLHIDPAGSSEGFRVMERFVEGLPPGRARNDLEMSLSGRKPFRTFKDRLLNFPGLREQWFAFHDQAYIEIAREWLEDEGSHATLRLRTPS